MVILTIKIRVIWISRAFLVFCLSVKKYGKLQIDRKTETKKGREIQITQILIVSITISYIFCALEPKWGSF